MELEACFMDDWDLEAIVRGYGAASTSTIIDHPNPHQYSFSEQDNKVLIEEGFPEFSETTNFLFDDLEDLYKPFYPLPSYDTILSTSLTIPQEVKAKASEKIASQDLQLPLPSKCKTSKKKKQKKSVVKKVVREVDGGYGDAWSWRKYGQKPIKGSPYPRSYYKCSSSKGCLARKQVERSHLDPKVFLVTYTASEHNHSQPIRRNSLAGSTRKNNSSLLITPSTSSSTQQTCSSPLLVASSNNVEDGGMKIVQQSKEVEKEDEDLLEWLGNIADDDDHAGLCDGWVPTKELEEFIYRT